MRMVFRNLRLVDASRDELGDLAIEDGLIAGVGPGAASKAHKAPSIDIDCSRAATGEKPLALMPAFVDLHGHFREPGFSEKETIESGCLAAAAGGFGTVVAMANTSPATDKLPLALAARDRGLALGLVDYLPAMAATRGLEGRDVSHLDALEDFLSAEIGQGGGEVGWFRVISDDGRDAADDPTLLAAMRRAATLGFLVACHCELGAIPPPPGREAEAWYASAEGLGADRAAEIRGVERAIRLAREAGCALHLCHLSTRESVDLVRKEKARQAESPGSFRLSCEVTPHHLALGAEDARRAGPAGRGRVNPWLREGDDRLALLEGLHDGTIDTIATDHAPHTFKDKAGGAPGFSGLETAFAAANAALRDTTSRGGLSGLSRLMSARPAAILGLDDRGRLETGLRADLVLVDPEARWKVDTSRLRSRGKNCLFEGRELVGRVLMTIHEGRIVYDQY